MSPSRRMFSSYMQVQTQTPYNPKDKKCAGEGFNSGSNAPDIHSSSDGGVVEMGLDPVVTVTDISKLI